MNGNTPVDLTRTTEFHRDKMDEQARIALEENAGLKSYIESLNNECLDLNAALFEEANKMVRLAGIKQSNAERLANEKAVENEALRSQMEELRAVISSLPSPLAPGKAASIPPMHRTPLRSHRRKSRHGLETQEMPVYRMSVEDLRLLAPSSSDASALTTVSRGTLLNALLANEEEAEEMDIETFKLFVEWTKIGFPLNLPIKLHTQHSMRHVNLDTDARSPVVIVREVQDDCNGEDAEEEEGGSDADEAPSSVLSYAHQATRSATISPFEFNLTGPSRCCGFIQRLFEQDIRPCLHFADPSITMAVYQALPTMSLDMVPLEHRYFLHATATSKDSTKTSVKICPLLPPMDVHYRLTVKLCSQSDGVVVAESPDKGKTITADISASARDRIAAVVSLFQYLSLVGRGLATSAASSRSVSLVSLNTPYAQERSRTLPGSVSSADLSKQFRKIQRLRLVVALSRLGFGLPQ